MGQVEAQVPSSGKPLWKHMPLGRQSQSFQGSGTLPASPCPAGWVWHPRGQQSASQGATQGAQGGQPTDKGAASVQAPCSKEGPQLAGCSHVSTAGALVLPPPSRALDLHITLLKTLEATFLESHFWGEPHTQQDTPAWAGASCGYFLSLSSVTPDAARPCPLSSTWPGVLCYQTFNKCYF